MLSHDIKPGTILLVTMNNRTALIVNKETFPHEHILLCDEVAWSEPEPYSYTILAKQNSVSYEITARNAGNGNVEVVALSSVQNKSSHSTSGAYIGDVNTERFCLEVYECSCGFHIGLDASYLEQVSEITMSCPACSETIQTLSDEE